MVSSARVRAFQEKVLAFYKEHRRDFPWRDTRHPYAVLVSEVMLQQTQTDRVKPKFDQFLLRFPTFEALA
jgi:A/G-specific adenine glycosylase